MSKKIRFLMAKPGLDGHEAGAKVISKALRDAGMEVIYTGSRQTAEAIVNTALQEDVDVIGLSILSGSHKEFSREIVKLLKQNELDIPVMVGGIIPPNDVKILEDIGVKGVFGPGSSLKAIVNFVKNLGTADE